MERRGRLLGLSGQVCGGFIPSFFGERKAVLASKIRVDLRFILGVFGVKSKENAQCINFVYVPMVDRSRTRGGQIYMPTLPCTMLRYEFPKIKKGSLAVKFTGHRL
jgi:hypothetical protein